MKRQRMIFEGDGSEQHKLLEYKRLEALIGIAKPHLVEGLRCYHVLMRLPGFVIIVIIVLTLQMSRIIPVRQN